MPRRRVALLENDRWHTEPCQLKRSSETYGAAADDYHTLAHSPIRARRPSCLRLLGLSNTRLFAIVLKQALLCLPIVNPELALDKVRTRRGGRSARVRSAVLKMVRDALMEGGYANLSHVSVGRRAGVDPATVYRRWPTRARLAVDAIVDLAESAVPMPDTGTLRGDLTALHRSVARLLRDQRQLRLFQAFSAATVEDDAEVAAALEAFWCGRFRAATVVFQRAEMRGEIAAQPDPAGLIEQLVAPAYFRALVSRRRLDRSLTVQSVDRVMLLAGAR